MPDSDISPGGIRLIRESRGEDRQTFADRLNVSPKTVGNWERGDSPPNEENREKFLEAIPAVLSLEDAQNAEAIRRRAVGLQGRATTLRVEVAPSAA